MAKGPLRTVASLRPNFRSLASRGPYTQDNAQRRVKSIALGFLPSKSIALDTPSGRPQLPLPVIDTSSNAFSPMRRGLAPLNFPSPRVALNQPLPVVLGSNGIPRVYAPQTVR